MLESVQAMKFLLKCLFVNFWSLFDIGAKCMLDKMMNKIGDDRIEINR